MPRTSRKDLGSPFLHVMVQGINKEYIFYDDEHIKRYLNIIKKNKKDYEFTIIAYCIMNNHAHFLIYTKDIEEYGKFMQKVNLIYAQFYNKEQKRCGMLFRNRYQAEPIFDRKYLINCIKYIHDNPVKAGIVKRSDEYKYSSCNDYLNNRGECHSKIMEKIFGKNYDYREMFDKTYLRRFIDIEEDEDTINGYIKSGIEEFMVNNKIKSYDIFFNKEVLRKLIYFLKEKCKIKYVEIRNYFDISYGIMENLKLKG